MAYIGQGPFQEFTNPPTKDSFTGDGSTTTFDLNSEVPSGSQNALEVFVNNVRQEPGTGKAFTLGVDGSGDMKRITFSAAPASGAAIYVINDKTNSTIVAPLQNDLNGTELILDADADTSIHAESDDIIDLQIAGADVLKFIQSSGDAIIKVATDAKDLIFQQADGNKLLEINDGNFVGVGGNSTAAGAIRIFEDTDNGSNYVGLSVGNVSTAYTLTFPNADGSSGQALTTDGSGTLSFTTMSANTPSSADGQALGSASLEWSDLFLADGGTIKLGNDQDVVITHVADTGILLSGTNVIQFNDASQNIGAPSNAILDINATDEIELNATLVDVNANLDVSGTIVSAGTISGTLATAAQGNITSLGTLTTLTVDNVITNGATIGHTDDTDLITLADGIATIAGEISVTTLDIGGTNVTTTAAEINLIDGGTSRGTTALADADGLLINDDGTMRMTTAATVKTYMQSGLTSTSILDADSDTKIQVEESSDEDTIRYDVAGAEVATQTARGFEFTAVGGFVMNQTTNSQTFTIAATENAIVAGPIALSGTITVSGSLAVV